jgi:hypothetical protein
MTETLTTAQLQAWFEDTEKILSDVSASVRNLKRIEAAATRKKKSVTDDFFGTYLSKHIRFTLVVQLCKLYVNKDTERRNFRKLFNRLKYDKYNNRLKQRLKENRGKAGLVTEKAELIRMVNDLVRELEARDDLIYRLRTLRDRLYAHSDPVQVLPEVRIDELDDLVKLAVRIFDTTSGRIFGHQFVPPKKEDWENDPELRDLEEDSRKDSAD